MNGQTIYSVPEGLSTYVIEPSASSNLRRRLSPDATTFTPAIGAGATSDHLRAGHQAGAAFGYASLTKEQGDTAS